MGTLCRDHFPDLVHIGGRYEPAWMWEHYAHAPDQLDRENRCFDNKAERVKAELWVSISRNTLLNTSHSFDIFLKITGYIMVICRISTGVTRDTRNAHRLRLTTDASSL